MEQLLDGAADVSLAPFRGDCPRCFTEVLVVELRGADVVVEVDEVLGTFPCPQCAQVALKGHARGICHRCSNTGWVGVPLPIFGVALSAEGSARYWTGGVPAEGEAVLLEHLCR